MSGASPFDRGRRCSREASWKRGRKGSPSCRSTDKPLEEQLRRVAELPEDSVVDLHQLSRRHLSADRRWPVKSSNWSPAPRTRRHSEPLMPGSVRDRGGDLYQYDVLAERAAGLDRRLLKGESASSLAPDRRARERADVRLARAAAMGHRRGPAAGGEHRPLSRADGLVRVPLADQRRARPARGAGSGHCRHCSSNDGAEGVLRPDWRRQRRATARSLTSLRTGSSGNDPTAHLLTSRRLVSPSPATMQPRSSTGRPCSPRSSCRRGPADLGRPPSAGTEHRQSRLGRVPDLDARR